MLITWPRQFSVKKYFDVDDVTDPVFGQERIRYRKVKGKQTMSCDDYDINVISAHFIKSNFYISA